MGTHTVALRVAGAVIVTLTSSSTHNVAGTSGVVSGGALVAVGGSPSSRAGTLAVRREASSVGGASGAGFTEDGTLTIGEVVRGAVGAVARLGPVSVRRVVAADAGSLRTTGPVIVTSGGGVAESVALASGVVVGGARTAVRFVPASGTHALALVVTGTVSGTGGGGVTENVARTRGGVVGSAGSAAHPGPVTLGGVGVTVTEPVRPTGAVAPAGRGCEAVDAAVPGGVLVRRTDRTVRLESPVGFADTGSL